jgi:tetratricopeptide (TPR) repeat protein
MTARRPLYSDDTIFNQKWISVMARFQALAAALLLAAGTIGVAPACASDNPQMDTDVARIGSEWARIKYQVHGRDEQYRQIAALASQAAAVSARYPGHAEPLLWQGIVTSEEAGMASMFQQLGLARAARDILNRAAAIDSRAANGGVPMSLGVLYYRVPGFPIGFGSTDKARTYLKTALAMDPNGLDANYFYGDFLKTQGDYKGAAVYLDRALHAPADPRRPVWDAGRRSDVRAELVEVRHKGG